MSVDPGYFVKKIGEINQLYLQVKSIMILAENFDKEQDAYVAPINELRNALDHILRSYEYPEKIDSEFSEATEHLYRAGYDAYEILAINIVKRIVNSLKNYPTDVITSIFPEYFHKIKPLLTDIQVGLADTRAHKRLDPETGVKSFHNYQEKLDSLIDISKRVDFTIPELEAEKQRVKKSKNRQKIRDTAIGFLIAVLVAVIGQILLKYYYDRNLAPTKGDEPIHQTGSHK
jgi:hypothetical protein